MKTRLITSAALALSFCTLAPSCGDKTSDASPAPAAGDKPAPSGPDAATDTPTPAAADVPSPEIVRASLPEALTGCTLADITDIRIMPTGTDAAGTAADVTVLLKLHDDLYTRMPAPAELARLRSSVNPIVQEALKPDACFLLLAGEAEDKIPQEAKAAYQPEEPMKSLIQEILALASPTAYAKTAAAGDILELRGTLKANKQEDGAWTVSETSIDLQPLKQLDGTIVKDLVPQNMLASNEGQGETLAGQLKDKIAKLQEATTAQNIAREQKILAQISQQNALRQAETEAADKQKAEREAAEKKEAEAKAAARKAEIAKERKQFISAFGSGESYVGEWACGTQTGKLSLVVMSCDPSEKSALVEATLADPYLDGAIMELKGRVILEPESDEPYRILLNITGGSFDPDAATANIYRRTDGILQLNLQDDGALKGIMSCPDWDEKDKKIVKVFLRSETAMQQDKADKKSGKKK